MRDVHSDISEMDVSFTFKKDINKIFIGTDCDTLFAYLFHRVFL